MKYIGKRKVHALAVEKSGFDVPKCSSCSYRRFGGYERLDFSFGRTCDEISIVEFTIMASGNWIHIVERDFDTNRVLDDVILY